MLKNPFVRNYIYHYLYHIPSSNCQKLTIKGWPLKYAFQLILEKSVACYVDGGAHYDIVLGNLELSSDGVNMEPGSEQIYPLIFKIC